MDGFVGHSSTRNAGNVAALASLLPQSSEGRPTSNTSPDQSPRGPPLDRGLQWHLPASGRVDPAGDPRRQGFSGLDSSSKASLLGCLIVRGEGSAEDLEDHQPTSANVEEDKDLNMMAVEVNTEGVSEDTPEKSLGKPSTPLSPLRNLIRAPWNFITSPWRDAKLPDGGLSRGTKRPGKGRGRGSHKDKGQHALMLARKLAGANPVKFPIEDEFDAETAKQSKKAKRETLLKLLSSLRGERAAYPLTASSLKALASVLKLAGYKSGANYMMEAKLAHIELGHSWNQLLDRVLFQCKRALERGRGPRKRAPEVPEIKWSRSSLACTLTASRLVRFPRETFMFSMIWLLREIELSRMTTSDVRLDFINKKVTLLWRTSKTDHKSQGVGRVLQCLCGAECTMTCPFRVSKDLVERVEKACGTSSPLASDKGGEAASKHLVVKAWSTVLNFQVTGHSARRTGALRYVRLGWAISQIAYLGRWKSSVVYSYAEEALEQVAVNVGQTHHRDKPVVDADTGETTEDWKSVLKEELKLFKSKVSNEVKVSKDMVIFWKKLYEQNAGNLPPLVLSTSSKVVHVNVQCPTNSPPLTWKTACGWRYYGSSFNFINSEKVTCAKCQQLCAS